MRAVSALIGAGLLAGCAGWVAPPAPVDTPGGGLPIQWVRNSLEYAATTTTVFRAALSALDHDPARAGVPAGRGWAVVLDADETLLDNSAFQQELQASGRPFSDAAWQAWGARRAAGAVPGAAEYLAGVHERGGAIVIVTNRTEAMCADTRANLDALFHDLAGHPVVDAVLCMTVRDGIPERSKQARYRAVSEGRVVGAVEVLQYVGDSIQDFPDSTAACAGAAGAALAPEDPKLGRRYFVLPNPMYGGWTTCTAGPFRAL